MRSRSGIIGSNRVKYYILKFAKTANKQPKTSKLSVWLYLPYTSPPLYFLLLLHIELYKSHSEILALLASSCYLEERPVIMSKCLLLLINSCNYRGESWVTVCGNHSSGRQWHSCVSPSPVTEPHALSDDLTVGNSNSWRFCKLKHLIISAQATDQLGTAVKQLSGSAVGYGLYDFNTWLFSFNGLQVITNNNH